MRKFLLEYLSFTRTETRIILIISVLLFIMLIIRICLGETDPANYSPSEYELKLIREFISSVESNDSILREKSTPVKSRYYQNLKSFDPNNVQIHEMKNMGFPERIIQNILKFRKAGGRFHKPGDIKKIYGMTDSSYLLICPFIIIKTDRDTNTVMPADSTIPKKYDEFQLVNINTADSIQLVSLNGIGPVSAVRILKYREKLGGFAEPDQLLEVYGMDAENYNIFKDRIYINSEDIRKMDINEVSFSELIRHPYMDKRTAESIMEFRNFRGRISDIHELYIYNVINEVKLNKIRPYFLVDKRMN